MDSPQYQRGAGGWVETISAGKFSWGGFRHISNFDALPSHAGNFNMKNGTSIEKNCQFV